MKLIESESKSELKLLITDDIPKDRKNLIYCVIFFLGLSGHLPWNAVLTAQPYFKARLSDSSLGSEFTAHFAIIFKALKLMVFAGVSVAGLRINSKFWVVGAALGNVLVFSILGAMVEEKGSLSSNGFYLITLSLVMASGTFLALFECGMYSILGTLPSHLTQSFMAGNSIGGILAALSLIISFYSASSNIYSSTRAYFIISSFVFLLSMGFFIGFMCTDYFKFYQKKLALYTVISQTGDCNKQANIDGLSIETFKPDIQLVKKQQNCSLNFDNRNDNNIFSDSADLIRKLWSSNCALFLIGFVNLTIFPALVSVTESTSSKSLNSSAFCRELFVPLAFLIVSAADLAGKMLPAFKLFRDRINSENFDKLPLISVSLSRLFLIPLFLLGNICINGKYLIFPKLLASDKVFFGLLTLAFVSGSYICTIIMVIVPKKLEITEQSRATVLLCSASLLGVFAGSVFSLCLKLIIRAFTK